MERYHFRSEMYHFRSKKDNFPDKIYHFPDHFCPGGPGWPPGASRARMGTGNGWLEWKHEQQLKWEWERIQNGLLKAEWALRFIIIDSER